MLITLGSNRTSKSWRTQECSWDDLLVRLSNTVRTDETASEYRSMSHKEQGLAKDHGGFIGGGLLADGRRTKSNIAFRTLITLDADFAEPDSWEQAVMFLDCAMCCYSTHSHTEKLPRLRYVIPLDRKVSPEEYEPIARMIASDIGIDQFDVTTYETARLFYWPSTPKDGPFFFAKQDGPFLSADDTLARYKDWRVASQWPTGSSETKVREKAAKKQGDPQSKNGIVGRFCRAYDVPSAIEKFLPGVYEPCDDGARYTYSAGSTAAGAVLYDNGLFLYSNHATDPAGGQLLNAFDLVRIHLFRDLDGEEDLEKPITEHPSYKEMCRLAQEDDLVKTLSVKERYEKAQEAFASEEETDVENWAKSLEIGKSGETAATVNNFTIILENDPNLAGCIGMNLFKGMPHLRRDVAWRACRDKVNGDPWTDEDKAELVSYFERSYGMYSPTKLDTAFSAVLGRNAYHPVQEYLNRLVWDGVRRVDTLFIDCLGAENTEYTRTVTRKWLTAAVARVMSPGVKFDNLVVLVGAQGIGKSYLGNLLGRGWFSDTFGTVQGKEAYEQLQGSWIIEIAELSAMKRAEVESVKMFISKQEDTFRGAYRQFSSTNKRQCVFYGTTNDRSSFLRDATGNRRFWPVVADKRAATKNVFDLTGDDIDQIWAEAVQLYKNGENLYLNARETELAVEQQNRFSLEDPRIGEVEAFLERLLPENWESLSKDRRRDYMRGVNFSEGSEGTTRRNSISVPELAYEMFDERSLTTWKAKEYQDILAALPGWRRSARKKPSLYGDQYLYERIE